MSNEDLEFDDALDLDQDADESFDQAESFVQDGPDLFGEMFADAATDEAVDPDFVTSEPPAPEFEDPDAAELGVEPDPAEATAASSPVEATAVTPTAEPQNPTAEDQPLALYRRYRPDDFADLIGQEQVTEPLMRAIANNKVNHAYLFSGPRGCGKTTSARILARCLNCEQGPTAHPCGQCQSCRDLATGGPGSIDVIEIDAASHGLVEDARDLRERAYFAPVSSRFKVYIIDEAHMVTTHGFNALLKVVEEPPPHVKFIFATTEPDKVIGTIRSRTHHYPFRLVPPRVMTNYLEQICAEEGVRVDRGVLPLVVRAGGGSVRDSLSVLDQLLGAAGQDGVSYDQAAALLGFTPDALLDEMVDAFAAGDGRGVFATIDKVIEVGQDPRRFAEDLLQRMRDLVIVAQVPDAISSGLIDAAADQAERLTAQAAALGAGELTRAAEVIATGLTQMRGTTAPRLHLELICARVLLPGSDVDQRGVHARLDRLERRLEFAGSAQNASGQVTQWHDAPAAEPPTSDDPARRSERDSSAARPSASREPRPAERGRRSQRPAPEQRSAVTEQRSVVADQRSAVADQRSVVAEADARQPSAEPAAQAGGQQPSVGLDATEVRRLWPRVLDEVKSRKRFTHALLSQNAQVADVADGKLFLAFSSAGVLDRFKEGGSADVLADSIIEVLGVELKILPHIEGQPPAMPSAAAHRSVAPPAEPDIAPEEPPAHASQPSDEQEPEDWAERANPTADHPAEPVRPQVTTASDALDGEQITESGSDDESQIDLPPRRPTGQRRQRPASSQPTAAAPRSRGRRGAQPEPETASETADDDPTQGASPDDVSLEDSTLAVSELLARELDAELIEE